MLLSDTCLTSGRPSVRPSVRVSLSAKDDGSGGDNWSYRSCKVPVKSSPPTNQHPVFFTGRMPFLSPNQQRQSTERKISQPMDLLTPSSPGGLPTLSLTTNSSWLPWGDVCHASHQPSAASTPVYLSFLLVNNVLCDSVE